MSPIDNNTPRVFGKVFGYVFEKMIYLSYLFFLKKERIIYNEVEMLFNICGSHEMKKEDSAQVVVVFLKHNEMSTLK